MITPKEEAKELFDKMCKASETSILLTQNKIEDIALEASLIAVSVIVSIIPYKTYKDTLSPYDGAEMSTDYWDEVTVELNLL